MSKSIVVDGGDEMYFLYQDGELLTLCVLVSSGMYNDEILFLLGEEEKNMYRQGGREYLDALAKKIRKNPTAYR